MWSKKYLMKTFLLLICSSLWVSAGLAQSNKQAENLVLITIDGLRWNEVFGGADSIIVFNDQFKT